MARAGAKQMAAEAGAGGGVQPPLEPAAAAADAGAWARHGPGGSTQATTAGQAPSAEGAPAAASGDPAPEGPPPRRKSFAEALYRALIRLAPSQRPQVLAVFRFLKQHPAMAHAQVQPTLVAALGLDLVRTAWLEARREVDDEEDAGPGQLQEQQAVQLEQPPQAQAPVRTGRRLRAASVDGEEAAAAAAATVLGHEEEEDGEEMRRVRPRLAVRQETVTWRAGEEVPVYLPPPPPQHQQEQQQRQPGAGEGLSTHHHHQEPRPDEHHPRCPLYAPAPSAGPPPPSLPQPLLPPVNSGGNSDDEEEYGEAALQAAAREAAARDAERERALEEWEGELDARFQVRLAAERAAAAAEANGEELGLEGEPEEGDYADDDSLLDEDGYDEEFVPPPLPAVPVALLLAKEEPALEDEDWLQEGAPDGFICPISYRLLFEPVVAQDGYTYQRSALEKWIGNCQKEGQYPRSPMTNLPMAPWYVPSHTMKSLVGQYIAEKRQQRSKEQQQEQGLPTPTGVVTAN